MNSYFKDKIITSEIEFESSLNGITRVYPCILEICFNKKVLFYSKKPYIYKNPNAENSKLTTTANKEHDLQKYDIKDIEECSRFFYEKILTTKTKRFYNKYKKEIKSNSNYLKETIEEFKSLLQKHVDTIFV